MKKIIHLSDLHSGGGGSLGRQPEAVVDALIEKYRGTTGEYVVVITGDLVQSATLEDYSLYGTVQEQLTRLTDAGFELVVVPGNHDLGTGSIADKQMVEKFEETFYGDAGGFPRLFCKGGIAFIVLNSMEDEAHWYDKWFAEGEIGHEQIDAMVELFLSDAARACEKRVLCLHHHPFDWLPLHQLRDKWRLRRALRKRIMQIENGVSVDAMLYGHNHRGKARFGRWGISRAYDSGSATLKRSSTALTPRSHIREIDLDATPASDGIILEP